MCESRAGEVGGGSAMGDGVQVASVYETGAGCKPPVVGRVVLEDGASARVVQSPLAGPTARNKLFCCSLLFFQFLFFRGKL